MAAMQVAFLTQIFTRKVYLSMPGSSFRKLTAIPDSEAGPPGTISVTMSCPLIESLQTFVTKGLLRQVYWGLRVEYRSSFIPTPARIFSPRCSTTDFVLPDSEIRCFDEP